MSELRTQLEALMKQRILLLDGAMGTMLQSYKLGREDYHRGEFADSPIELTGNSDLLSLTRPDVISEIHHAYLEAGSDIIETNTFAATPVGQSEYRLEGAARAINLAAVRLARQAADAWTQRTPDKPRFVAGAIGPTTKSLSMSPDVNDPGFRAVTFDDQVASYAVQVEALLEAGVDLLLIETQIDTLVIKAAIYACKQVMERRGAPCPIMISGTLSDASGRLLSGQTVEAFWYSIRHANPLAVGLNCGLGATEMRVYIEELSRLCDVPIICYPNAGLPNAFGEYDELPEKTARLLKEFGESGLLNIVGGCCGTNQYHIAKISTAVCSMTPRVPPRPPTYSCFSGLEGLTIRPESNFQMIGERTNVAGSRKFLRLIRDDKYNEALAVALEQVRGGANILDVNMDEGMLDSEVCMTRFLNLVATEPEIARIPIMVDSSKWSVIVAGLRCIQGKGIVNSISLKEGEDAFLSQAREIQRFGAGVVVMAFDEVGQADSAERKVEICERAYKLLIEKLSFNPYDIIFDPNVLAVATGMAEHNDYAIAFITAAAELRKRCPHAHISGGISNLSFSFRGNDMVREAMNAAFLFHAIKAGLTMGIVNAGQLAVYEEIEPTLLTYVEDVLLNRRPDATERLVEFADTVKGVSKKRIVDLAWREASVEERIKHALVKGVSDFIVRDVAEANGKYDKPLHVIEGPMMDAMKVVGELFGAGKMFLPQVVKSARVMKEGVAYLTPLMEQDVTGGQSQGKVVIATVKGDVHDIGKNIVAVVLRCNNYEVIDLGVMVPIDRILDTAVREGADIVGLSGLITPSLDEMVTVAKEMERRELQMPLLIGGATTSRQHTAVKIAPVYARPTAHVLDASLVVGVVSDLLDKKRRLLFDRNNRREQEKLRALYARKRQQPLYDFEQACERALSIEFKTEDIAQPSFIGRRELCNFPLSELVPFIDWTFFFHAWGLRGKYPALLNHPERGPAAKDLLQEARALLSRLVVDPRLTANAVYGFWPAAREGQDIVVFQDESRRTQLLRFHNLRQQQQRGEDDVCLSLADFVAPVDSGLQDHVGAFAVTAGIGVDAIAAEYEAKNDDYSAIMVKALADRLAEAFAELLHARVRREWGYGQSERLSQEDLIAEKYRGIRPAFGYPACPDHSEKPALFELLQAQDLGIELSEHFAMMPAASVSGLYLAHPQARYFMVGPIGRDQVLAYAAAKGMSVAEVERWLAPNLSYEPTDLSRAAE